MRFATVILATLAAAVSAQNCGADANSWQCSAGVSFCGTLPDGHAAVFCCEGNTQKTDRECGNLSPCLHFGTSAICFAA